MKLEVNITKTRFFVIVFAAFVLAGAMVALAFDTGGLTGSFTKTKEQAVVFGHSADELVVKVNGNPITIQELLKNGVGSGSTPASQCVEYVIKGGEYYLSGRGIAINVPPMCQEGKRCKITFAGYTTGITIYKQESDGKWTSGYQTLRNTGLSGTGLSSGSGTNGQSDEWIIDSYRPSDASSVIFLFDDKEKIEYDKDKWSVVAVGSISDTLLSICPAPTTELVPSIKPDW